MNYHSHIPITIQSGHFTNLYETTSFASYGRLTKILHMLRHFYYQVHVLVPYDSGADPGFFLGGGVPAKEWCTRRKQILIANTKKKAGHLGGGGGGVHTPCTLLLARSASVIVPVKSG